MELMCDARNAVHRAPAVAPLRKGSQDAVGGVHFARISRHKAQE